MPAYDFAAELCRYGPKGSDPGRPELAEANAYCRRLARGHYENFTVLSRLLPRRLRQHVCNIYAYCRWADDLADEVDDARTSLELLAWWRNELHACYCGRTQHPVFVALADTVGRFEIPPQPFLDLVTAFERDQRQHRYETLRELLDYCRCSANPVGRLVLYLAGSHVEACLQPADSICTGLQLANFCQDVASDWARGRIYLPSERCRACGCAEADFEARRCNDAFRELLRGEVTRAESYLRDGWPLVDRLPREMRLSVDLFVRGGLAILALIRQQEYDVWTRRPTVGRWRKLRLFAQAWWGRSRM